MQRSVKIAQTFHLPIRRVHFYGNRAHPVRLGDLSPVTPVSLCCDAGGPNPAGKEKHDGVGSSSGPALRTTRTRGLVVANIITVT